MWNYKPKSDKCKFLLYSPKQNFVDKIILYFRPMFMTSTAQVIIAISLIAVEILAIVSSIVLVPPVPMLYYPSVTRWDFKIQIQMISIR